MANTPNLVVDDLIDDLILFQRFRLLIAHCADFALLVVGIEPDVFVEGTKLVGMAPTGLGRIVSVQAVVGLVGPGFVDCVDALRVAIVPSVGHAADKPLIIIHSCKLCSSFQDCVCAYLDWKSEVAFRHNSCISTWTKEICTDIFQIL